VGRPNPWTTLNKRSSVR